MIYVRVDCICGIIIWPLSSLNIFLSECELACVVYPIYIVTVK
jgi:hypothetical protein